jgi:hypothetical protein
VTRGEGRCQSGYKPVGISISLLFLPFSCLFVFDFIILSLVIKLQLDSIEE